MHQQENMAKRKVPSSIPKFEYFSEVSSLLNSRRSPTDQEPLVELPSSPDKKSLGTWSPVYLLQTSSLIEFNLKQDPT